MIVRFMARRQEQPVWFSALLDNHVQRLNEQPRLDEHKKLLRGMELLRENVDRMILFALATDTSSSPARNESSAQLQADN